MTTAIPAILAVLMIVTAGTHATDAKNQASSIRQESAPDPSWNELETARRFAFDRVDGSSFDEVIDAWGRAGLKGSFGESPWAVMPANTIGDVVSRFMDRSNAHHWVDCGWILLVEAGDADRAEHAFAQALTLDNTVDAEINDARDDASSRILARAEAARHVADARLSFVTPEARAWPSTPWPRIAPTEVSRADRAVRSRLDEIIRAGGLRDAIIETEHFLIATDFEDSEPILRMVEVMESTVSRLNALLQTPQTIEVFPTKVSVVMTSDRDRFLLMESQLFDHLPSDGVHARCHCEGRQVTIVIHESELEHETVFDAVRQVCFAYLHGYGSPIRMPAWANEGFATWVAVEHDRRSIPAERIRRASVLTVRRDPAMVENILDVSYADESAMTSIEERLASIGYLLIDLIEFRERGSILTYVRSIKQGRSPAEALRDATGLTWRAFLGEVVAHYRINN